MSRIAAPIVLSFLIASPAAAQGMDHSMHGMTMPGMAASTPKPKVKAKAKPAKAPDPPAPSKAHAGHDMSSMSGMDMGQASSAPAAGAAPAAHVGHDMSAMPGMVMPQAPTVPKAGGDTAHGHAGHDMTAMPGMAMPRAIPGQASSGAGTGAHAEHDMASMPGLTMGHAAAESEPAIPETAPPPAPADHFADRVYGADAMAIARRQLAREHGGETFSKVMFNLAEYQARTRGGDGYRWEGEAWYGGDITRFVVKSEGEGSFRGGVGAAEVQALYSRAATRYFDLQAGVRQDFRPRSRTYLTVGTRGLAPYWFDVSGALFLSTQGELLGRVEGTYDLRLTQRLILQPRVELNLAAQDTPETRTGAGLSTAELGLRLRYEIRREFAPYIGISYDRRFGRTADFTRAAGEDASATSFVVGVRTWF